MNRIDPRGQQFAAALTAALLLIVLTTAPSPLATSLLALQAGLFAIAVFFGVRRTPQAWLFTRLIRPRLSPPTDLEDAAPPRFAQAVGLGFALVGLAGFLVGAELVGLMATGFALTAALLNAVFGLCLGCEIYLLFKRVSSGTTASPTTSPTASPMTSPTTSPMTSMDKQPSPATAELA